ncbi:MAG: M6 family metalloprotease domain-containing protein [Candidatus Sumerlaeia bacterium]|nr:M6 family metalloprotease domain-containing protein [Candidatus Sumerlaeia bacterium]
MNRLSYYSFMMPFVVAVVVGSASTVTALTPLAPDPVSLRQPDGTTFTAFPKGGLQRDWLVTREGRMILKNQEGQWVYAEAVKAGADPIPGSIRVGQEKQAGIILPEPGLTPSVNPEVVFPEVVPSASFAGKVGNSPNVPLLVLHVGFSDTPQLFPASEFQALLLGGIGSVREYYQTISRGELQYVPVAETQGVANDGIVQVTLGYAHPNMENVYGASTQNVVRNGLQAAASFVNFSVYDTDGDGLLSGRELSVVFILAGYETAFGGTTNAKSPGVWGHVGTINYAIPGQSITVGPYGMFGERHARIGDSDRIATIGIMAHELGHLTLSLPDLYDTDLSTNGVGNWCLMSYGTWRGNQFSGDAPAGMTGWCLDQSGFLDPIEPPARLGNQELELSALSSGGQAVRLWIDPYKVDEYFLLEHRATSGIDMRIPANGLLITHIDNRANSSNANDARRQVDVEEADGLNELDLEVSAGDGGDVFPGSTLNRLFSDFSIPSAKTNEGNNSSVRVENIQSTPTGSAFELNNWIPALKGSLTEWDNPRLWGNLGFRNRLLYTAWEFRTPTELTKLNVLEGIQLRTNDANGSQITVSLYDRMVNARPTELLHVQGPYDVAEAGWQRLIFDVPYQMDFDREYVLVVKIENALAQSPGVYEALPDGNSEKFWVSSTNTVAYIQLNKTGGFGDLAQHILLGSTEQQDLGIRNGWIFE